MHEARDPEPWRHHSVSACAHVALPVLAERFFRWTHAAGSEGAASSPEPPRAPLLDLAIARAGTPFGAFVSVRCANPPMVLDSRDIWALPRHGIFSEPGADRIPGPVAMLRLGLRGILDAHPNLLRHPGALLEFNIMHDAKDEEEPPPPAGPEGIGNKPRSEQDDGDNSSQSSDGADTLPFPLEMEWGSEATELGEPVISPSPCPDGGRGDDDGTEHPESASPAGASSPAQTDFDCPSPFGASLHLDDAPTGQPFQPPADRKRGYLVCSTLGERALFMPHSAATLHESEEHILAALGGRIRGPVAATVSFSVQRLTASVFEVVRLLWRTSIGRCLRGQLEEFVRVRWAGNLPAAHVSMLQGTPMKMTTSFDPSDLVRNARTVTRWFSLSRHVRQESGRGGGGASQAAGAGAGGSLSAEARRRERAAAERSEAGFRVVEFAEAFLPVSALQKLSGRALSHAAALLLGCGAEVPFSDAWARSAAACVGVVLVGSRMPMHVAIEMAAALSAASLAVPRPAMDEIGNLRPASLDTPSLMAATALLHAAGGGRHAWRSLVAVLARWCDEAMCGPTSRPRPFAMFGTDELASLLLALSYVPRAELVPVLRTAWLEVLGECCRRWLVGMPFLVARNLQARAQINDTLALALSTMM